MWYVVVEIDSVGINLFDGDILINFISTQLLTNERIMRRCSDEINRS